MFIQYYFRVAELGRRPYVTLAHEEIDDSYETAEKRPTLTSISMSH